MAAQFCRQGGKGKGGENGTRGGSTSKARGGMRRRKWEGRVSPQT